MTRPANSQTDNLPDHCVEPSFSEAPASHTSTEADEKRPDGSARAYTVCGVTLVIFVAVTSAVSWWLYPVFVDTYYHMAVVYGFKQAGGVVTQAFWEMAPAGRVHIYPPALHAAGYLFTYLGLTPRMFVTFVSWAFYAGCMLTTWLWLRRVAGPRSALFAVALLCGPSAFFWNQSAHTANAAMMVVAPLALLALETKKFLTCAVLNFIVITLHPMGLFLPPALVINTLLRRKKIRASLLAAVVPVLLYGPWLAHVWANRALVSESRMGAAALSLTGHGVNISLVMAVFAALAIPWLLLRRGSTLTLLGAVLGFAVVFPMGYGSRFFMFNIHWPLACLGGFGLGELMRRLEKRPFLRPIAQVASLCVALAALIVFPSLDLRLSPPRSEREMRPEPPPHMRPGWQAHIQSAALPRLFDPDRRIEPGPGPGAGGMDLLRRPGAEEFFDAIHCNVTQGDVIFMHEPPAAALITGVTGRWTSSGMLSEVRSAEGPPQPQDCDFAVILQSGGRGRAPLRDNVRHLRPGAPPGFEKVFENEYGSLWRNPVRPQHNRQPGRASVPLPMLLVMLAAGLLLVTLDLLPAPWPRLRKLAPVVGAVVVAGCLLPLTRIAVGELRNPPTPPPQRAERPLQTPFGEDIHRRHERVHDAVRRHIEHGIEPDYFWPREDEERFHRLMQEGSFQEANQLLENALQILGDSFSEHSPPMGRPTETNE